MFTIGSFENRTFFEIKENAFQEQILFFKNRPLSAKEVKTFLTESPSLQFVFTRHHFIIYLTLRPKFNPETQLCSSRSTKGTSSW